MTPLHRCPPSYIRDHDDDIDPPYPIEWTAADDPDAAMVLTRDECQRLATLVDQAWRRERALPCRPSDQADKTERLRQLLHLGRRLSIAAVPGVDRRLLPT